jgi:hypothetical protein
MKKTIYFCLLFLATGHNSILAQCAMCRSAVESTMSNGRNLSAVGLNTGILYLLLAPYILVGTVGYLWYRNSKKNRDSRIALEQKLQQFYQS